MDKKRLIYNLAYWLMIIVVIATCYFGYQYLTGNSKQCLANPLEYYQEKMNVSCSCFAEGEMIGQRQCPVCEREFEIILPEIVVPE